MIDRESENRGQHESTLARMSWRKKLLNRVQSIYKPRRTVSPDVSHVESVSPSVPTITEEEAVDFEDDRSVSIISEDEDQKRGALTAFQPATVDLASSNASEALSDAFSVVFDPKAKGSDINNFWSTYRYLNRRPTGVFFSSSLDTSSSLASAMVNRPKTVHSSRRKPLEVFIDGPHGAPSSGIFAAEHAVLVATGIGVTPFASILQAIMHRHRQSTHTCPKCEHTWSDGLAHRASSRRPAPGFNLRKVDFIWINREQKSFEWFLQLLSQIEMEQAEQQVSGGR